jgi:hypothetical protein
MMALTFQPRGLYPILDGEEALWFAYFFERGDHKKSYNLFYYPNGQKVWMTQAALTELSRSKKRKPFPVDASLLMPEAPPLEKLFCSARSFSGELSDDQRREMEFLTGRDSVLGRSTR